MYVHTVHEERKTSLITGGSFRISVICSPWVESILIFFYQSSFRAYQSVKDHRSHVFYLFISLSLFQCFTRQCLHSSLGFQWRGWRQLSQELQRTEEKLKLRKSHSCSSMHNLNPGWWKNNRARTVFWLNKKVECVEYLSRD